MPKKNSPKYKYKLTSGRREKVPHLVAGVEKVFDESSHPLKRNSTNFLSCFPFLHVTITKSTHCLQSQPLSPFVIVIARLTHCYSYIYRSTCSTRGWLGTPFSLHTILRRQAFRIDDRNVYPEDFTGHHFDIHRQHLTSPGRINRKFDISPLSFYFH